MFYALLIQMKSYAGIKAIKRAKRVLFVTSHPDDEVGKTNFRKFYDSSLNTCFELSGHVLWSGHSGTFKTERNLCFLAVFICRQL